MKTRLYLPLVLATLSAVSFPQVSRGDNEVGFIEKFALAPDREKALQELIPGSEDYYYFHALHYQNTRNEAKLASILEQWKRRFPDENERRRVIENREALLDYDATPQATLNYLRERLKPSFHHQRMVPDQKPNLPTALDQKLIASEVYEQVAREHDQDLSTLELSALEKMARNKVVFSTQQRRALLKRLDRPDFPGLVELLNKELKSEDSPGLEEFPVVHTLLPEQLEALARAIPDLATDDSFVEIRLSKLAPSADVNAEYDLAEQEAWLERLWGYAKGLPGAFNTLKTHILYRRLVLDRKKGVYDAARFLEYLKIPRAADYVNEKWLEKVRENGESDLSADFGGQLPGEGMNGNDEALVKEYFIALFQQAAAANPAKVGEALLAPYPAYVRSSWLKRVLAEALVLGGSGEPERWAAWLTPTEFQALKDRVEIDLPPTNLPSFAAGAVPQFDVLLKNTPTLLVRIYELNTLNFYLTQKRQLNTDVPLDGLVANREQTLTFDHGPFKRFRQTLTFPELKDQRGAWIVELVGGGKSSRALLRSGAWEILPQSGPAGDLLLVLNEKKEPVPDAVAWLDGRKYVADPKLGRISIPPTNEPNRRPIVIADAAGNFATLTEFEHHGEDYRLDVQMHIEREQMLNRREATLAVRVALLAGESHLDVQLLEEPKLKITITSRDGIETVREIKDLSLKDGAVWTGTIAIPDRLHTVSAVLTGKVAMLSGGGEKREMRSESSWGANEIALSPVTKDVYLVKSGGTYALDLLGRNGEPKAEEGVVLEFTRKGFHRPQEASLKTDDQGRVQLGTLAGIESVTVRLGDGRQMRWDLQQDAITASSEMHARTGEAIKIPAPLNAEQTFLTNPSAYSLLQVNGETFVADLSARIKFAEGFVVLDDLPPGDYSLRCRETDEVTTIKVTTGPTVAGWVLGRHRFLHTNQRGPVQITNITTEADVVTVKLANATAFTRVHVAATRFVPSENLFTALGGFDRFDPAMAEPAERPNLYSTGREIGDEYRYILERRLAKHFPGNLLTRPGLLLQPWAIRDTELNALSSKYGENALGVAGDRPAIVHSPEPAKPLAAALDAAAVPADAPPARQNLDFLAHTAPTIYNLIPDQNGVVRFDRKALGDRQQVQILAEDLTGAVWRSFALPEAPVKLKDLRLSQSLPPAQPFTLKREVSILETGRTLTLTGSDSTAAKTYDSLEDAFRLLATLGSDQTIQRFDWILRWPTLKEAEKREKYSEFACHELNFFLARKDPDFFQKVVKPAIAQKKDRTFLDAYLTEADLTPYLSPWAFSRLNVVERILLGQRLPDQAADIARSLRERWELLPRDPAREADWFDTALYARAAEPVAGGFLRAAGIPGLEMPAEPTSEEINAPADSKRGRAREALVKAKLADGLSVQDQEMALAKNLADAKKDDAKEVPAQRLALFAEGAKERELVQRRSGSGRYMMEKDVAALDSLSFFAKSDLQPLRDSVRVYYRALGPTKEWAENNYYQRRITEQGADLIPLNAFWRDYAKWRAEGAKGAFLSPHFLEAHQNFPEMMLALAVLDLPFNSPKHTTRTAGTETTLTAGGPVLVFHRQLKPAPQPAGAVAAGGLLVSQSFFRDDDRYRMEGNEKFEKSVTTEFLVGVTYGASVVATNPTSTPVKAEILLQIPQGAIAVKGSQETASKPVTLAPYTSRTFEYAFYFPAPSAGELPHYPVNISVNGSVAGSAPPRTFRVVNQLTQIDKTSWEYVSQNGSEEDVFAFLEKANLQHVNLERIAWRCQDAAFFKKLTAFLTSHHVWNAAIYSYAVLHNEPAALREWLQHQDAWLAQCGPWLSSTLLRLDPIARRAYEHLEYSPLVNQRAHRLGGTTRIANPAVLGQYRSLLDVLSHKPGLEGIDQMSVACYLFLQDRVEEALPRFRSIDAKTLPTTIQYDYFSCYADFYEGNLTRARTVATKYTDYPVPRWQKNFAQVLTQLDEIEGRAPGEPGAGDPKDREARQAQLAATEPGLEFKVENQAIQLTYRNLTEVTVNYYLMDPEFSFSSSPFLSGDANRLSIIKPTHTATHALPKDRDTAQIPLPPEMAQANVLVEVAGAGQRKAQAHHSHTLQLVLTENYGRLEVREAKAGRPLPKAYVKVYARLRNGTVRFFKDGYTDLRGRFDYSSLNSSSRPSPVNPVAEAAPANGLDYRMLKPAELNEIEKFAILVMSPEHGATTREVGPLKQ